MEEESGRESMGKRGEKSGREVDILARRLYDKGENGAEESLSVKKRGGEKGGKRKKLLKIAVGILYNLKKKWYNARW